MSKLNEGIADSLAHVAFTKESTTRAVPAEIDTEKNRGLRAIVYRFDKEGKVIKEVRNGNERSS